MALINTPEVAMRLARTIISDIVLYNKERVQEGIRNDNIFELLEKELKEGEELYKTRLDPDFAKKNKFLQQGSS